MMNEQSLTYFAYTVIGIAIIAIISGFALVGSPAEQRARRFDEQRVNDLVSIQSQIYYYWQSKRTLPPNLDALKNDVTGFVVPKDPENQSLYEYQLKSDRQFVLCATFNRPSLAGDASRAVPFATYSDKPENWAHETGRTCYERTIDPAFLPPLKTVPQQ